MILPNEFCERMQALLGSGYDAFIRSYDTEINKGIRINRLKCADTAALARELGAEGRVLWCPDGYYIDKDRISGSHPYHAAGVVYFQEPSAMCAAEAVPLGNHVLDLCAAPGGKTTRIAERMGNRGLLVSNEIIQKRAAVLSENVERMGLKNTIVTNESPARLSEKFPSFFDSVIVDAPCSGEGMFRKEPQAVQAWSVEHTLSCAVRQKNILDDAYRMLSPGGYIMYSTCTFSIDENERVVEHMAEKYGMEICDMPELSMLSPGIGGYPGIERCRRVFPQLHKGEGHFAALLKKPGNAAAEMHTPIADGGRKKRNTPLDNALSLWREFEAESLNIKCDGAFVLFGDNLYLMPEAVDTDKLRIVRCGLHLGTVRKNRFVPAHALSHAFGLSAYKNAVSLDEEEAKKYMRGEVVPGDGKGWCVAVVNGFGIGWGKASGGMVKNHYPKGLRIVSA